MKDRWFTAVAALALALGIGVNATVFTFVNAVLVRGLPFNDPGRIMSLGTRDAQNRDRGVSYLDFVDWRAAARTFTGLAAFNGETMNVSDEGRASERFQGPYISANAFALIGQRPLLGRDFRPTTIGPAQNPWSSSATASGRTATAAIRPSSAGRSGSTKGRRRSSA